MIDDRKEREPWQPDEEPADESWSLEHPLGDPDAWRGESADDSVDAWRNAPRWSDWPEWDAGPEYQMWKRIAEEE